MLIVFANTKGGVGKSTLAAHLAIWLFDAGYRVGVLDADEQGTVSTWLAAAEPKIPVKIAPNLEAISKAKRELAAVVDIIVADSPGSSTEAAQAVTLLSDIAVVPLQPSKPDVRAIKTALKFVRLGQEMTGGKKPEPVIVLTFTAKRDLQTKRLRAQLQGLGVPVAVAEVRRLNAFRDACDSAVTRMETPDAKEAAFDIDALFRELFAAKLEGYRRAGSPREQGPRPENIAHE